MAIQIITIGSCAGASMIIIIIVIIVIVIMCTNKYKDKKN